MPLFKGENIEVVIYWMKMIKVDFINIIKIFEKYMELKKYPRQEKINIFTTGKSNTKK